MANADLNTLIGLFGKSSGTRLYQLLNPCCDNHNVCCPSEKYTITQEFVACSLGNTTSYRFKVNSTVTIEGFLGFTPYFKTGSSGWSAKTFSGSPDGITVEDGFVTAKIDLLENTAVSIVIVDTRGNWSNILTFTTQNCP